MKLCISVCKVENCETEMKFHFEKTNKYVEIHRNRMNGIPLVFQNSRWLGLDWWMLHNVKQRCQCYLQPPQVKSFSQFLSSCRSNHVFAQEVDFRVEI